MFNYQTKNVEPKPRLTTAEFRAKFLAYVARKKGRLPHVDNPLLRKKPDAVK